MNKITNKVKENSLKYGSIPFWSWNDKLEPEELKRQIKNMHDLKIAGFFMHARGGLETEYLSDEWYEATRVCIEEAKKYGMEAWAYDENGWPSGFAGGKLLEDPDNHSVFLKHEINSVFPEAAENYYAVYALIDGMPVKTDCAAEGAESYLCVKYCTDASYVDTLRADITEKFIEETHVQYEKIFKDDFGGAMPGFFTDEPQYYRYATPYSKFMPKWFEEEYGYSVFDAIPAMFLDFDGAESLRYDYNKMLHIKFMEGFARPVYDWACEHGIQITGHGIAEETLEGQIMCQGSVIPFYEYEHIPGIDYLCRPLDTPLASKQLGSACAQLGKKKALSEMFACCGWDVTPTELKHIAELQYAGGVNIMCQHLYPYSERGQRKRDYPAHYSDHNPWQEYMYDFNGYFNNLGYMLAMGREASDILVIHPIHSGWLTYQHHTEVSDKFKRLENDFKKLFCKLSEHQIPYHFGEESMMLRHGSVENGKIKIGLCAYSAVILPELDTLDANTAKLLSEFKKQGGTIYTANAHIPTLIDGRPAEKGVLDFLNDCADIYDEQVFSRVWKSTGFTLTDSNGNNIPEINSMLRDTENGKLFYFTNLYDKEFKDTRLTINGISALSAIDIQTLEVIPLRGRMTELGCEVLLDFDGSKSFILTDCDALPFVEYSSLPERKVITLKNSFEFEKMPENLMTLDRACVSYDGEKFTEERPIERIRDNLLFDRYKGELYLSYSFDTEIIPSKLSVIIEKPGVKQVKVNGKEVEIGDKFWFDRYFADIDITDKTVIGKNTVTLCYDYFQKDYVYHVLYGNVMESLRNCLVFDTELEAIYLRGDFAVKCDTPLIPDEQCLRATAPARFSLTAQKKSIDISNTVSDGYPFYGGRLSVSTKLSYSNGAATVLKITGRYCICEVEVNGQAAGTLMFDKYLDIAPYLKEGENKLTLTLCNSYRNLMGPHHIHIPEPDSVWPKTFSFEGQWDGGECPKFNYGYSFVRFGIDVE